MHQVICLGAVCLIAVALAVGLYALCLLGVGLWVLALVPGFCLAMWGFCASAFYPDLQERYQPWQVFLAWPMLPVRR